jgi:hypothetical protein
VTAVGVWEPLSLPDSPSLIAAQYDGGNTSRTKQLPSKHAAAQKLWKSKTALVTKKIAEE